MSVFKRKKIATQKSLGEILRQTREEKHFGLLHIAKKIQIPEKYLNAIEQSQYQDLPDEVYTKNFLKTYVNFLGLDFATACQQFKEELTAHQRIGKSQLGRLIPPARASQWSFFVTPRIIKSLLIAAVLVVSLSYLGLKIKAIFSPPLLVVTKPAQDLVIAEFQIEILGQTQKGVSLKVNNKQVIPDDLGFFKDTLSLHEGLNTIQIIAKTRYSQEAMVERIVQVVKK